MIQMNKNKIKQKKVDKKLNKISEKKYTIIFNYYLKSKSQENFNEILKRKFVMRSSPEYFNRIIPRFSRDFHHDYLDLGLVQIILRLRQ